MELHHLEYFVAVAEERNFTRAAARLHVVQSAVSASVKSLERELGAQLLERTSKRVALTDAGAAFLPKACATLDAARDARDAVDEVRGGLRGTLRIGVMTSVTLIDVPALVGRYHQRYPGVDLHLVAAPGGSRTLAETVIEGTRDMAIVSLPGPPPAGLTVRELASDSLNLVVAPDHPMAGRQYVSIAELDGETFIDFPEGYGNRVAADRAFAAAGLTRRIAVEITNIADGADYVRHGLGIALLPHFIVGNARDLAQLTVTGADLRFPIELVAPAARTPSAAARALLAMVESPAEPVAGAGGSTTRARVAGSARPPKAK